MKPPLVPSLFCVLFLLAGWPVRGQEKPHASPSYSSAGTVADTNSMDVLDDRRQLSIGDRVSFRVVEDRKEPRALVVSDSGEMEVPLIGRVQAANRTCRSLAYAVKALLEKDYYHRATVIIGLDSVTPRSKGRVYLVGQVRTQGALDLPSNETLTLSKAILRAGGFADYANQRKVRLVRKSGNAAQPETTTVDVTEILKGHVGKDPVLEPEDMIIVPEKLVNF
jgi:protein involved in polysaccharide export with SLBB domain